MTGRVMLVLGLFLLVDAAITALITWAIPAPKPKQEDWSG